jgi:hypothetical protein
VGAGTGAALDIARKGNVDLVLVHAKSLEEKFVSEGYGIERIDENGTTSFTDETVSLMRDVLGIEWKSMKISEAKEMAEEAMTPSLPPVRETFSVPKDTLKRKGTSLFSQRTLKRSMVLYGTGLHSGMKTGLLFQPLPPNSGILFGNISSDEVVPAHLDYVQTTEFATSLKKGRATAKTIEHLMAVLHAYRITNLMVKMIEEIPIMDGSALEFCKIIEEAGVQLIRGNDWVDAPDDTEIDFAITGGTVGEGLLPGFAAGPPALVVGSAAILAMSAAKSVPTYSK